MKKLKIPSSLLLTITLSIIVSSVQAQIDHWESVILEGDQWNYLVPNSQPAGSWINLDFDDASWNSGPSGFGYGDDDDNTILAEGTVSVYLRKTFTILSKADIESIYLHLDYDDGFVAYLNGQEIARSLVSGNPPSFQALAEEWHEAVLKDGFVPERFEINPDLMNLGQNVLAIQVHNQSNTSSDMSAIPILSLGINNTSMFYRPTPEWFDITGNNDVNFTESNLPIVVVNTFGITIPNEPKIDARIGIIYNGENQINRIDDPHNELDVLCGIELRGESSLTFDKKSYGFETRDEAGEDIDVSFLNFPEEEDFILYGPYSDKTMLNNVFSMHLARGMGHYSSRTRMVELVINDEYLGVYVIMEKIKRDENRLDIAKLNEDEVLGDDVTGGYIFRIDKGNDQGWTSEYDIYGSPGRKIFFQYFVPKQDEINNPQKDYIKGYVDNFEDAISSLGFRNSSGKHYTELINVRSFVDNFILNELSKDLDAYRNSTYFYKDKDSKNGKLAAGPFWDFNLAYGNTSFCNTENQTSGWMYYDCVGNNPFWWDRMLQDTIFSNALKCRWNALRLDILRTNIVDDYIDSLALSLEDAQERNFQKWPTLDTYIWPNSPPFANLSSHGDGIEKLKRWIRDRSIWMDINMPGKDRHCEIYENFDDRQEATILGVNDDKRDIKVYPNPAQEKIEITGLHRAQRIKLAYMDGKLLFDSQIDSERYSFSLRGMSSGIYLLSIIYADEVISRKIIIE